MVLSHSNYLLFRKEKITKIREQKTTIQIGLKHRIPAFQGKQNQNGKHAHKQITWVKSLTKEHMIYI